MTNMITYTHALQDPLTLIKMISMRYLTKMYAN